MADNDTTYQPATATGNVPIASDDVAGVRYQRVKATFGVDGSATDVSAGAGLPVAGQYTELTGTATATGTVIASTDVRGYSSVSSYTTGGSAGNQFQAQFSNDNTNWVAAIGIAPGNVNTSGTIFNSASGSLIVFPVIGRYFRLQCTSYSSGTTNVSVELSTMPAPIVGTQGFPVYVANGTMSNVSISGPVSGAYTELTGSQTGTGQIIIASTDVRGYSSAVVRATGSANFAYVQFSNDGINWTSAYGWSPDLNMWTQDVGPSRGIITFPVTGHYMRLYHDIYSSGTTNYIVGLSSVNILAANPVMPADYNGLPIRPGTVFQPANDGSSVNTQVLPSAAFGYAYNGSSWDRLRSANAAAGTTGTGIPAAGSMYFDGTNWQRVALATPMPISAPSNTATLTNVTSSATSVVLLASNTARKGAIIYNDSTSVLYVKFGATASATSFTYYIGAGQHLELPTITYTGEIDGIWVSANGFARVTELT